MTETPFVQQQDDGSASQGALNDRLNTHYIDLPPEDNSIVASAVRTITGCVAKCCSPRQILVILRLLKAVTFCFLGLTIAADLMYIFLVELIVGGEVSESLGGWRDTIIRIYGLCFAVAATIVELDVPHLVQHFTGLKSFIPRSLFLFFIAVITNCHLLSESKNQDQRDDDQYLHDLNTIPQSAVVFQMVTSWILALCALVYFVLGVLCFDRFTSRAFLSKKDPVRSTAIPQSMLAPEKEQQIESSYEPFEPPAQV